MINEHVCILQINIFKFSYKEFFFLICTYHWFIFFFTDIILAGTYFSDGNITYGIITLCFVIISSIIVQVFSVRWHQMDDSIGLGMSRPLWIAHTFLMGVLHRYFVVIDLYKEAIGNMGFRVFKRGIQWSKITILNGNYCIL